MTRLTNTTTLNNIVHEHLDFSIGAAITRSWSVWMQKYGQTSNPVAKRRDCRSESRTHHDRQAARNIEKRTSRTDSV